MHMQLTFKTLIVVNEISCVHSTLYGCLIHFNLNHLVWKNEWYVTWVYVSSVLIMPRGDQSAHNHGNPAY